MDVDQPSWQSAQGGAVLPEDSLGEAPARWAEADAGISSAVRIHGHVLELAGRV